MSNKIVESTSFRSKDRQEIEKWKEKELDRVYAENNMHRVAFVESTPEYSGQPLHIISMLRFNDSFDMLVTLDELTHHYDDMSRVTHRKEEAESIDE